MVPCDRLLVHVFLFLITIYVDISELGLFLPQIISTRDCWNPTCYTVFSTLLTVFTFYIS